MHGIWTFGGDFYPILFDFELPFVLAGGGIIVAGIWNCFWGKSRGGEADMRSGD